MPACVALAACRSGRRAPQRRGQKPTAEERAAATGKGWEWRRGHRIAPTQPRSLSRSRWVGEHRRARLPPRPPAQAWSLSWSSRTYSPRRFRCGCSLRKGWFLDQQRPPDGLAQRWRLVAVLLQGHPVCLSGLVYSAKL